MFKVSDEERASIRKQHEEAMKKHRDRQEELKSGLKKPEVKKEEPKKEKKED